MPTRPIATKVVKTLSDHGYVAYFAGGWVRDFLMQHPSDDIDIATSATVGDVQRIFEKTIPVGVAFGIVIVVMDGHHFEVATFRKDRGYVDGRRPTGIDSATPEEDAQRRDFTINGLFYDPIRDLLLDYVDGQKDIKKKVLRAIGDPHERFLEDRLRMMRAVRYSTRFNFPIESETLQAILSHAESLLPSVAIERVWQEFKKMSRFAHFDSGLVTLHKLKLLPTIFPQLKDVPSEEIQARLSAAAHFPSNTPTIIELLELFPHFSLQEELLLCESLKLSRQEKEVVSYFHRAKKLFDMPTSWQDNVERIEWAKLYSHPENEICLQVIAAHYPQEQRDPFLERHATNRRGLEQAILRIQSNSPIVRAEDLIKQGIAPSVKMGKLLKEAEKISINQDIEDREVIIALLKQSPLWSL